MENNLLFPSAAVLLQKCSKEGPGPSTNQPQVSTKFSSCNVSTHSDKDGEVIGRTVDGIQTVCDNDLPLASGQKTSTFVSDDETIVKKGKRKKHEKHQRKKKKKRKLKEDDDFRENCKIRKGHFDTNKPDTIWLNETKLDPSNAFRRDCRSDRANYEFNSLYKKDIADFFPLTSCQCLGLGKHQCITLYPNKAKRKKTKDTTRYFNIVKINDEEENNDFINTIESEDYIPIVLNKPAQMGTIKCSHIGSQEKSNLTCLKKNRYYSKCLSENPSNVSLWSEFVDYQDEIIFEVQEKSSRTTNAVTEKKMSILDKALEKNPLSIELILKFMEVVHEIWTHDRVKEKWSNLLFQIPNRGVLWRHYLLYLQSDMLSMTISSVLDTYRSGFRILIGIMNGTVRSHPKEENAEEELLMFFVQMVIFLWQAGHTEKALSLLQCMVELNHFCPENMLNEEHKVKLASFEQFFDSQFRRFGTIGACGWNQNITNLHPPSSFSSPYTTSRMYNFDGELEKGKKSRSSEELWLVLENARWVNECMPFSGSHEDCEDTERIILFDDISFSLFNLSSPELKHQLILVYLCILGTPVLIPYLNTNIFRCFSVNYMIEDSTAVIPCFCHYPMFSDYVMIDSLLLDEEKRPNHYVISIIRTIFSQYLSHIKDEKYIRQISQLWFHFESLLFRFEFEKSVELEKKFWVGTKKFMKSLLKMTANRSCVNLWNMYATYEYNIGNVNDAKKVFTTVLQMTHADKNNTISKVAKIVRVLINVHLNWNSFDIKDPISAETKRNVLNVFLVFLDMNRLMQTYETETPNPISLLKVWNLLRINYESIQITNNDTDFLCCYVVFVHFFHGLEAFIELTDDIAGNLLKEGGSFDYSAVFIYILLLLKNQRTSQAFLAYKQLLDKCVKVYPGTKMFGTLFNSIKQFGLGSYYARRFYENQMIMEDIRPWLHAIDYEEKRLQYTTLSRVEKEGVEMEFVDAQTGIHNRIRSLYDRLLFRDAFKHCSTVWLKYLQFQLQYGSKKQSTETLYLALKNNPGVKKLYLFACQRFNGKFEEMLRLMVEKELRIKLIVEEFDILLEA